MKGSKLMIAVAGAFLLMLVPAFAQTVAVQATIPFNFSVGRQNLPGGEYRVSLGDWGQLWISRVGVPGATTASTSAVGGGNPTQDPPPKLIFNRYGDRYFLSGGVDRRHESGPPVDDLPDGAGV